MGNSPRVLSGRSLVAYLRVSTDKQGIRGLGIEAQRKSVIDFAEHQKAGALILAEYVEVESGRRADRPELLKAIDHARNANAILVIAKLDRLSRDVHFLTGLDRAGVEFVACDMPNANRLTITILAAVAEHEREMISERTRQALAIARERIAESGQRGHPRIKRLGNPHGAAPLAKLGNREAVSAIKRAAAARAERLRRVFIEMLEKEIVTSPEMAAYLNEHGIRAPRGGHWHPTTVARTWHRLRLHNASHRRQPYPPS